MPINHEKDVRTKESTAMTPTQEDFNRAFERVHDKLDANKDHFTEKITALGKEVASLKTKVEMTPKVKIPERPCDDMVRHLEDHKKIQFIWVKSIVGAIVSAIATALGTAWVFLHKSGQ